MTGVALAGILAVLHSCLDLKATIGGSQYHHILYFLTPAMKPRMLMTVDKDMNLLPVSVRVGQAVDVVAQVGRLHSMLVKSQITNDASAEACWFCGLLSVSPKQRVPHCSRAEVKGALLAYREPTFPALLHAQYTADRVCGSNITTHVVWMGCKKSLQQRLLYSWRAHCVDDDCAGWATQDNLRLPDSHNACSAQCW